MKKTITTIALAIVITFTATATFAGDGILVAGRPAPTTACGTDPAKDGILVAGRGIAFDGIKVIISLMTGILVGDRLIAQPCTQSSDRTGILVAG